MTCTIKPQIALPVTWACPVFNRGDKVKCRNASGIYTLTEGKEYTVYKYEPRYVDTNYTWPAYVHVVLRDYQGKLQRVVCHAHRFVPA